MQAGGKACGKSRAAEAVRDRFVFGVLFFSDQHAELCTAQKHIKPEFDHEAYENQEIEKDANYFADSVMKKGTDAYYYV